jgi:hypothetical protein
MSYDIEFSRKFFARAKQDRRFLVNFPFLRNRSYVRRNNRVKENVFTGLTVRGDGDLNRTIIVNTLFRLNG